MSLAQEMTKNRLILGFTFIYLLPLTGFAAPLG